VIWVVYVAHTREIEMYTKFLAENLKERDQLEDLGIYGRMLKWIKMDLPSFLKEVGWESMDLIHVAQIETSDRFL
jgi:hypothetical protein